MASTQVTAATNGAAGRSSLLPVRAPRSTPRAAPIATPREAGTGPARAGSRVHVTLPEPYGRAGVPARYVVVDAYERELTLRPEAPPPAALPPVGTPCLIGPSLTEDCRSASEAIVVASGPSMLIVDVVVNDRRHHPRYRCACAVRVEVPGTAMGCVEGVLEDLSAGGLRARMPVLLPVDHRVFVSVLLPAAQPIAAIAVVRGAYWSGRRDHGLSRLQFRLMAPSHRARLDALLAWAETAGAARHGPRRGALATT